MSTPRNPLGDRAQALWQFIANRVDTPRLLESIARALKEAADDPGVMQEVEAYGFAADTLARHTAAPPEECLGWVVESFGAKDPKALACLTQRRPAAPALAQRLSATLLEFRVAFRKVAKGGVWQREFTVFISAEKGAVRVQRTDDLDWSDLPETVRTDALGARRSEVNFTLWPLPTESR
jgi:hypothetical protein